MSKAEKILEALKSLGYDYDGINGYAIEELCDGETLNHLQTKGGEGEGDYYHMVFEIQLDEESTKTIFMVHGYYDSWSGVDWYGSEILPCELREVTELRYIPI